MKRLILPILAYAFVGIVFSGSLEADDDQEPILLLEIARTCANEGFGSGPDCALIMQVVESNGTTVEDRLSFLRRHSPCASGHDCNRDGQVDELDDIAAIARPGNARWSRFLQWNDEAPPNLASWEGRNSGFWARTKQQVSDMYSGRIRRRPCTRTPHTWGGPMDHADAERRGLIKIDCGPPYPRGPMNQGYRYH